jgi:hypothetical protein
MSTPAPRPTGPPTGLHPPPASPPIDAQHDPRHELPRRCGELHRVAVELRNTVTNTASRTDRPGRLASDNYRQAFVDLADSEVFRRFIVELDAWTAFIRTATARQNPPPAVTASSITYEREGPYAGETDD